MPGCDSENSTLEKEEEPTASLYVNDNDELDQSSEDDVVEQLMSLPDEYANLPQFNALDPNAPNIASWAI